MSSGTRSLSASEERIMLSLWEVASVFSTVLNMIVIMRSVKNTGSWFGTTKLVPGKWNIVMWLMNDTHYVHYVNGIKTQIKPIGPALAYYVDTQTDNEWRINQNLDAGNFSVGPIYRSMVWSQVTGAHVEILPARITGLWRELKFVHNPWF